MIKFLFYLLILPILIKVEGMNITAKQYVTGTIEHVYYSGVQSDTVVGFIKNLDGWEIVAGSRLPNGSYRCVGKHDVYEMKEVL